MEKINTSIYDRLLTKEAAIGVVGLGYVGLPLALALAKKFEVIGFDINRQRVEMMRRGEDPSNELEAEAFEGRDIRFTADLDDLRKANFFIVAVPTPVDEHKVPNLKAVLGASETIGKVLKPGDYVVFESTVYPGCTEEDCQPIMERFSGLQGCKDFKIGYSPERINPGDKEHTVETILKIVAGCDEEALEEIAKVYGAVIKAGIYKASSIKVAEAAKVIENTQRDLNISFVNELAIIFDRMGIDTREVLKAAGTKWNFINMTPGLVGGHCIGVDPYYLLYKSKQLGYDPQVILSGRRINDGMPAYIAKRLVQILIADDKNPGQCKALVRGLTFKENVSDIRNSKVADLVRELEDYGIQVDVLDCYADKEEVKEEYDIDLLNQPNGPYDAVIVAVAHNRYKEEGIDFIRQIIKPEGIVMDLKGILPRKVDGLTLWRL